MRVRVSSSLIALSVSLSLLAGAMPQAIAAETHGIVLRDDFCKGRTGRDRGRCVGDANKSWAQALKDFGEKQETERANWKLIHADLGATDEYRKALSEFLKTQKADLDSFKAQITELRRALTQAQKDYREELSNSPTSPGTTTAITKESAKAAQEKCKEKKDSRDQRICLRQALKLYPAKGWTQR